MVFTVVNLGLSAADEVETWLIPPLVAGSILGAMPLRLLMSTNRAESTRQPPRPRPRPSPRGRASELPVSRSRLLLLVLIVGAEVTVIPRKELAAEVEPSGVARAFVMPEAEEPTGPAMIAVMITEPAATSTTTKDGGT